MFIYLLVSQMSPRRVQFIIKLKTTDIKTYGISLHKVVIRNKFAMKNKFIIKNKFVITTLSADDL